jgi:hypothetical protein
MTQSNVMGVKTLPFIPVRPRFRPAGLAAREQQALEEYLAPDDEAPEGRVLTVVYTKQEYYTHDGRRFFGRHFEKDAAGHVVGGSDYPVRAPKLLKALRRTARRNEQPPKRLKKKFQTRVQLLNAGIAKHNRAVLAQAIAEAVEKAKLITNDDVAQALAEGIEEAHAD